MSKFPYNIIDLTHYLTSGIPTWDGTCGFEHRIVSDYSADDICKFRIYKMGFNKTGVGTHIDAPAHCYPNGKTVDQILLDDLSAPGVIIDVSEKAHESYCISLNDVHAYQKTYGKIQAGTVVLFRTGWEKFWFDPQKYRNNYKYPYIATDVAEYLLKREVVGLGIDTLSPDRPEDNFPIHRLFLGNGRYLIENAANLNKMPAVGSYILALPMKIQGGAEAPVRLVGLINKDVRI